MPVSCKPEDFVEGTGLLDDAEVTFTKCRFQLFDYAGKAQPAPAFAAELVVAGDGEPTNQFWSCGSPKDFVPSADGKQLQPVGAATHLRKSCNAAILFTSLFQAGVPGDLLGGDDISKLSGLRAHVKRIPAPKRDRSRL